MESDSTPCLDETTRAGLLHLALPLPFFLQQMIQHKTLHIFLSKQTAWFWFAGKHHCLKPAPEPLDTELIVELCRELGPGRIVMFLEFPWVLTLYEITISLSQQELITYAKSCLGFPDHDQGKNQNHPEHITHPTSEEMPVGGIFFKQAQQDRVGLLCASLSKESIRLKKLLKEDTNISVEAVPLIVACMPKLLECPEDTLIFKGVEQSFFVNKTDGILKKYVELPTLGNVTGEDFVADQIPTDTTPQIISLFPNDDIEEHSGETIENDEHIGQPTSVSKQNTIKMEDVLSEWKGLAKSPQTGFWWTSLKKRRQLKLVNTWRIAAGVLILSVIVVSGLFYYRILNQNYILQDEFSSLELELEQHLQNSPSKLFTKREQHLEKLEEISKQLVNEAFWMQKTLQTILSSIEGAWLEGFKFNNSLLRLELLTLEPIHAVDLFLRLSKMSETSQVKFKSQQKSKIKGHEIIRFTLVIELTPPKNTGNQNLNRN